MNAHNDDPKLQKVLKLLESKQKNPGNTDIETNFYNEALEYLLSVNHWWCAKAVLPIAHEFFQVIDRFDIHRISSTIQSHENNFSMTNEVMCAILEVVYAPHLLKDPKCDESFGKAFTLIQQTGAFPTFTTETAAYIFRMTLYHHRIVRFWARKLLEKFITADRCTLSEDDFLKIKSLIMGLLQSFTAEDEFGSIIKLCPFTITQDLGEFWKSSRLVVGLTTSTMLLSSLSESRISMPQLILFQLSTSADWLGELLKTMTAMLLKMQDCFWGKVEKNSPIYYDIVKQICEHDVFQTTMKIAREGNTGKILQRDGTPYPDDKLMAKIKSMLEWIYPYWSSLRHTPVEKDITQKILDTTFGYFQLNTWGVMSKAYCAELGLQIIDQCLADKSVPVEKINEYIPKIVGFAKTNSSVLPTLVQHMPSVAQNILSDLVNRDLTYLNKTFSAIFKIDDLSNEFEDNTDQINVIEKSPYESIWNTIKPYFNEDVKKFPWLSMLLFKSYANIAQADVPNLLKDMGTKDGVVSPECRDVLIRFADIRSVVGKTLKMIAQASWNIRKQILTNEEMVKPILHLLLSPYLEIKQDISTFMQEYPQQQQPDSHHLFQQFFYLCQPLKVIEAFNSILREFAALTSSPVLTVFKSVQSLTEFLSIQVNVLAGSSGSGYFAKLMEMGQGKVNDEDGVLGEFWDVYWRTVGIIFDKGLQWASEHRPTIVVNLIMPILDSSTLMLNSRKTLETIISFTSKDASLNYDHINTLIDSLSHWIYVTRQDMIARLMPLISGILNTLKKAEIKISVEAYDRLMTAATGVNASKLTDGEKENLFMALSAHEPTNFIFLNDDSDDEDVEWQSVTPANNIPSAVNEPSRPTFDTFGSSQTNKTTEETSTKKRQISLNESFANVTLASPSCPMKTTSQSKTTKITNYFPATAEEPHTISDDEIDDEFADIDYSQVPEAWFEVKKEDTPNDSALSTAQTANRDIHFGHDDPMDIDRGRSQARPPVPTPKKPIIETPIEKPVLAPITALTSKPMAVPISVPSRTPPAIRRTGDDKPKNVTRFYLPESKQPTFAVTSKGRKLKPPSMGFSSKMKSLREEFRAERRLIATAKSPSAAKLVRQRYGVGSQENSSDSSESSSDEGDDDSGLRGLIYDMNEAESSFRTANRKAESASVKALFSTKPKRTIKLLETPITNEYLDRKFKSRAREQQRRQKVTPTIDRLYKTVFSWDITEVSEIPPQSNENMYNHVPSTFKTFAEYRAVFEPLLILETWCQLMRAKEQLSQSDVLDRCTVETRCHTNDFVDVTFRLPMSLITNNLSIDDLVCVADHFGSSFFIDHDSMEERTPWKGKSFLGKVVSINQMKNIGEVVIRCYFATSRISLLNSISPKTSWNILKIMSLTTTMREYAALEGLEYYDLGQDIIQPKPLPRLKLNSATIQQYCNRYDVNEPQAIAIVSAIQKKKGFSLIQGPPGTGKTKTILALIVSLLDQRQNPTSDQPYGSGKLLVCAPSNAAVDEITKRLKEGVMTAHGIRKPNVVRIGVADSVNASVKDRILDKLIEAEMEASVGSDGGNKWGAKLDGLHRDIRNIQISLDEVDREITQSGSDMVQMSILREKRKTLSQKLTKSKILLKDTYQDQKNHGREMEVSRVRARQKVFSNADVVCATLSGSGHDMLTSMGVSFETVIVDEAAQSIEISSLIPLKFDTKRCILVGDPNQLPPTVMSTLAAKYEYQQSLFMRLENTIANEVNLLSIQYRMHPEISKFPSKIFYRSRLLDGPNMAKNASAVWHSLAEFSPYRFFNVLDGQEKLGKGKSIFNVAEADAAVALVDMLCNKLPTIKFASKIGVITPYKQQVGQLKSRFQKRFGNSILDVIDFNTVDGFQGQEKEIIIFSCVRAGSGRGIGFLADMRRMNVGLTRAKCSLFVLGNARSLSNSEYWGDLVHDAKKRSLITDCEYPYFNHRIDRTTIPHNIFEKSDPVAKKRPAQQKRGPVRINTPNSSPDVRTSHKRIAHDRSDERPGVRRRIEEKQDVDMTDADQDSRRSSSKLRIK
ncbi:MAG: hypothetical protein EXX96DRAFT_590092 [Benjaminiella poitrasii]|nr:MAG: hypothetical protein EXX96DRAFT_590092 [Benjaminiella poitrasii]